MQQLPRSEALARLGEHTAAWVRVAAVRPSQADPWKVRLLEITTGAAPPQWEQRIWTYPTAIFDAYESTGPEMRDMLTNAVVRVGSEMVPLAPQGDSASNERRPSRTRYVPFQRLDWPTDETTLNLVDAQQSEPIGDLFSDEDAPSFAIFYHAAAWFFWGGGQVAGGRISPVSVHRHQDQRGRIKNIKALLAEEALEVVVEGEELDGLTIELAGELPGPRSASALRSAIRHRGPTRPIERPRCASQRKPRSWEPDFGRHLPEIAEVLPAVPTPSAVTGV